MWDQYFYGPDLVVAPVWETGRAQRDVHLPPGTWTDAWSGVVVEGPKLVTAPAALHQTPLYVRQGSGLDLGDLNARWAAALARAQTPPDLGALADQMP